VSLPPLASAYYEYVFQDSVRDVTFDNTLAGVPGAHVWAIKNVNNEWKQPEDWTTQTKPTFCREIPAQDVDQIILVVSNTSMTQPLKVAEPPRVIAGTKGCNGWGGTMTGTETWTATREGNAYSGTATSTFSGLWTLDPAADSFCTLAPTPTNEKVACVTYRPTGTVTWAWGAHISGDPPCNSTTAGSQDPANLPDKYIQAEAQLFFAPVDKDHLQVSGLGVVDVSRLDCGVDLPPVDVPNYFELSELAWSGKGPSSDGGTCFNTTWQIARTAGRFAGSCIEYAYDVPGDYTHKLEYTWNLTRTVIAPGG
jgi:hypothetical protein